MRSHAEERAASCMADFESKLAASLFGRPISSAVCAEVRNVESNVGIDAGRKDPDVAIRARLCWHLHCAVAAKTQFRRAEPNCAASRNPESTQCLRLAFTQIEHMSLDLRTQVVAMGLLSPGAKLFLESLAPIDETMRALEFREVELALEDSDHEAATG